MAFAARSIRGKLAFAVLLLALAPAAPPVAAQTEARSEGLCGTIGAIAEQLTAITTLELRHSVPCEFITKAKVNEFLNKRVKEVAKPEEIRAEELTLKKLGLAPPDFDLARSTVDLLTEQAAAFYDYDRKKLFIAESTPTGTEEPVLAHEMSHALADQHFNLGRFVRQGRKSDDGSNARLAVMEGQASWIMAEYLARKAGRSLKDSPDLVAAMSRMSELGANEFPVYQKAPLYLRRTLVFPYTSGMLFQNAIFERDGAASFAEVFERPPVSTQQILHPEKYLSRTAPAEPAVPNPHLGRAYKELAAGTLGELDHAILLEQYAGKERAQEIAPHWRGGRCELRENRQAGRVVLLYASEWDGEEAARLYFAAYREVLGKKWKKMEILAQTDDSFSGTGDDGYFVVRRSGAVVTSVEGLEAELH